MRPGIGLVVLVLVATAWGAAPPGQPRTLTAQELKELDALLTRLGRHTAAGEFEQAAKMAQQVEEYRRQRQGAAHWEAIDARFAVEQWRRLAAVERKDRVEMV